VARRFAAHDRCDATSAELPYALADFLPKKDNAAQLVDVEMLLAGGAARVEAVVLLEDDLMRRVPALWNDGDDGSLAASAGLLNL
jgi:hypothetical protein